MIELTDETLWFPSKLLQDQIMPDILQYYPNETGGMLLGYVNGNHRVVTALIDAGPNAKHSRYKLSPDDTYQQLKLRQHFDNTDGRESFLGEWHSHPESAPVMSQTDRRTLHRVTTKSKHLPTLPVMVIINIEKNSGKSILRAYRRRDISKRLWLNEKNFLELKIRTYAV